jgi:hypothetical protein
LNSNSILISENSRNDNLNDNLNDKNSTLIQEETQNKEIELSSTELFKKNEINTSLNEEDNDFHHQTTINQQTNTDITDSLQDKIAKAYNTDNNHDDGDAFAVESTSELFLYSSKQEQEIKETSDDLFSSTEAVSNQQTENTYEQEQQYEETSGVNENDLFPTTTINDDEKEEGI